MPNEPALPFPIGITITVYRDDGNWDRYSSWLMRPHHHLRDLFVARITLGHPEGSDEPDYDSRSWGEKAKQLIAEFPNCVFVYT